MRIGILAPPWLPVPPPGYGGTEAVIDRLARGFAKDGHDVVLVTVEESTCPVNTLTTCAIADTEAMGRVELELSHAVAGYGLLADWGVDLVHDHTLAGPLLASRPPGLPVVTTCHSRLDRELGPVYASMRNVAIVAISRAQAASAPRLPIARVIHHGIDVDEIPVGSGDGGYLLFLGRMAPDKGPHEAITVARLAGLPLVMAAKMRSPLEHAYFDAEIAPQLGTGADYVGEVGGAEKQRLLGGAVALLNPITWPEPFGLVMIEALAAGTPVIARPSGAAAEIVRDGVTGELATDEDGLVAAVRRADRIDRSACRADIEQRFSTGRMVADYEALFTELVRR